MNTRVLLLAGAVLALSLGHAAPAAAKANGHYLGPEVFDYSDSYSAYPKKAPAPSNQPSCYIEPSGPHSQIRWESDCARARRQAQAVVTPHQPSRYAAPRGFHSSIRWE